MTTPTRSLNLAGATNFRDLGGYVGQGGRTVRWRKLFRSDNLAALTADDRATLASLGLSQAFDFRGAAERDAMPYALAGVTSHSLAIEPTILMRMKEMLESGHRLTAQDTVHLMQQTYRAFVIDNSSRFAELFSGLLASDAPLIFHCTAGKDRTGFAAALILLALDVPRPLVMHDYLLTNQLYRMPQPSTGLVSKDVLNVLWRVQEDFLEASLHEVDLAYGGIRQYLAQALGVGPAERELLAAKYLQD